MVKKITRLFLNGSTNEYAFIKAEKRKNDEGLRWTERSAVVYACAKGGYAYTTVRYSERDRTKDD